MDLVYVPHSTVISSTATFKGCISLHHYGSYEFKSISEKSWLCFVGYVRTQMNADTQTCQTSFIIFHLLFCSGVTRRFYWAIQVNEDLSHTEKWCVYSVCLVCKHNMHQVDWGQCTWACVWCQGTTSEPPLRALCDVNPTARYRTINNMNTRTSTQTHPQMFLMGLLAHVCIHT